MPRQMAQQRMTLSDTEWPFHGLSVPSVSDESANVHCAHRPH